MSDKTTTRRNVLLGTAAAGVALPVLAACGSASGSGDVTGDSAGDPAGGSTPTSGIKTSEIPVGGGRIFPDQQIVVTQPTAGEFKAFSAVCTHQGCIVAEVVDQQIKCNCHFSKYSIEDGHVEGGPAPKPLPEKNVKVTGTTLTVS